MINKGQLQPVTNESVFHIVGLLKACVIEKDLRKGSKFHAYIRERSFLQRDPYIASSLINMYAKFSALATAQQVLKELPVRNAVTWNVLIAAYAQQGQGEEALRCYDNMQLEGHSPDEVTFTCALKACGTIGAAEKGKQIHDKIANLGMLNKNIVLGSTLVGMYAKCGALDKAQKVLQELPFRNVITWNALIAGYAQQERGDEALECMDAMQCEGHSPNVITFTCALKACGSIGAAAKGKQIHDKIVSLGLLKKNVMLGSTLVDMYAKCGALAKAKQVFEELPFRNMVTWSALIAGYAYQGQGEKALECFDSMQCEGHCPDAVTLICALKACGSIRATAKGKQIHDKIASLGMLERNVVLGNALADMYVKCGALTKAQQLLEELPGRNVVTWSTLLAGYAEHGQGEVALKCFDNMQCEGHSPNVVTFDCVLKACGSRGEVAVGKQIHDKIFGLGILEKNMLLRNSLVDMYAKCGALANAQQLFDELTVLNVPTWNTLIAGHTQQGKGEEALKCFDCMQHKGFSPNIVTFICTLKACGSAGAAARGVQIHEKIVSLGLLKKDVVLGSSLVDMYVKCGALAKAQQTLKDLPVRDVVTWSALIAGYTQQGQGEEALKCFDSMQCEGHVPDAVTFICALKACGKIGTATKGMEIHNEIVGLCMLQKNIVLGSALVGMYAKCGALAKAQEVLEELPVWDVVSWSALIGGYAQQGNSFEALNCFERMHLKGVKPDSTALICVLNACCHSGVSEMVKSLLLTMKTRYGIAPNEEHHCCMVDLFGRAGKLNKALIVIEKMPSAEYIPVWIAVLCACRKVGEVKIARIAFERAFFLDKTNAAIYICMTDMYVAAGMHEDAQKIEMLRVTNSAR